MPPNQSSTKYKSVNGSSKIKSTFIQGRSAMRMPFGNTSAKICRKRQKNIVKWMASKLWRSTSGCYWRCIVHFNHRKIIVRCCWKRIFLCFWKSMQVPLNLIPWLFSNLSLMIGCLMILKELGGFISFCSHRSPILFMRNAQPTLPNIFPRWIS